MDDKEPHSVSAESFGSGVAMTHSELREIHVAMANAMPGISRLDTQGCYVTVNEHYAGMLGYRPDELIGCDWSPMVAEVDMPVAMDAYGKVLTEGKGEFEATAVRKDGSTFQKLVLMVAIRDDEGTFFGHHCFMRDVTARHEALKVSRDREERLRILTDNVPALIAHCDRDKRYDYVNQRYCDWIGLSESEICGRTLLHVLGNERYAKIAPYVDQVLSGEPCCFDVSLDSTPPVHLNVTYVPDVDEGGDVRGWYVLGQDVSELKRVQEQLQHTAKLAALGQLGAGVAHELNQPLAAIQLFADMMIRDPDRKIKDFRSQLEMIREQTTRMSHIIDNIRTFASDVGLRRENVDPVEPLEKAVMLIGDRLRLAGIRVVREFDKELPEICVDATRLQEVFLNLLTNSLQALVGEAGISRTIRLTVDRYAGGIRYVVEDSGVGVSDEIRDRIFEPYFSTKTVGEGMGLGLSLAYGIAKEHDGDLRLEADSDTRFVMEIPYSDKCEIVGEVSSGVRAKGARVLVVDDEPVLRIALETVLNDCGWDAQAVGSAEEALSLLRKIEVDVVLMDLQMPGMGGLEGCRQIRNKWPEVGLVAISGNVSNDSNDLLRQMNVSFLRKPVATGGLLEALQEAQQA